MYPITIALLILATIAVLRNSQKIVAWTKNFCTQAELASPIAQLYQDLDPFEIEILHHHLQAGTTHELINNPSIALSALARELEDFLDPTEQIAAIERAIEVANREEEKNCSVLQS